MPSPAAMTEHQGGAHLWIVMPGERGWGIPPFAGFSPPAHASLINQMGRKRTPRTPGYPILPTLNATGRRTRKDISGAPPLSISRLPRLTQANQGRRERGVLCTRATEDADMRRVRRGRRGEKPSKRKGAPRSPSSRERARSLPTRATEVEGPAGEDQVYAYQEADCPVGGAGELGEDEDADQEAGDAAEADQAGALLAAGGEGDDDAGEAHEEEVEAEDQGQGERAVVRFDDQLEADDRR